MPAPCLVVRAAVSAAAIALMLVGCRRPITTESGSAGLREAVAEAIARQLSVEPAVPIPPAAPDRLETTRESSQVLESLGPRRGELDALSPLPPGPFPPVELGPDLVGGEQQRINLTLEAAIASAVSHNLGIQQVELQPAITAQDVIAAAAVFDTVLLGSVSLTHFDEPQAVPVLAGQPLGTAFTASETYRFETGLRKRFTTGGEVALTTDLTRFRNRASGISFAPDPAFTGAVRLGANQPLLRGLGRDVNLATIRLARNEQRRSVEQVRSDLLAIVEQAEQAYWDLAFAWRELAITEWLVGVGVQVRDVLERRQEFDTRPAQYSDAVARVEQRRADVIRARRLVRFASDNLKTLMNDPQVLVADEALLYPLDETIEAPITYNLREAILAAIDNRPELDQAALLIDDTFIRLTVADNQRLPLLDLNAELAYVGLDDSASGAYSEVGEGDFVDYVLGLVFEYPLGNRAADALYRQARLQRSAALLNYQQVVQNVIRDVKDALRGVITNYELILATRSFRVAQAENLRALLVEEETLAGLTPEFLNLKFTRQETLAQARRQEVQALVNFDKSLAALYRAMGTGLAMKKIEVEIVEEEE